MSEPFRAAPAATVTADALRRFTHDVFVRAGMPEDDAAVVAEVLVWADLRGVDTHGVSRIPMYLRLIDDGDLNLTPSIKIRTETAASILVDADRAAGPIAMTTAMHAAVRKARDAGVGLGLVRATTHTAALGYYTLMAARDGMAALALAASTPFMAYHGTRAPASRRTRSRSRCPAASAGPASSTWRRASWPEESSCRRERRTSRFQRDGRWTATATRRPILRPR